MKSENAAIIEVLPSTIPLDIAPVIAFTISA
jgi:hypothetical protein